MSRKTNAVVGGETGTVSQYNFLRDEAKMSAFLLASATSTLKLYIHDATVYFRGTKVDFTGGLSPVMSAPAASSRIDIVSLASSSEIVITSGVEADSPVAPTQPADNMPICEVYNKVSQTEITDIDEGAGKGYIYKDLRKALVLEAHASSAVKGIVEEATLVELEAGTAAGATGARLVANPSIMATSKYSIQLPTSDEKDALAGTGTPNSTNKYVTNDDTTAVPTANKVARYNANGEVDGVDKIKDPMTYGETIDGATLAVPVFQNTTDNKIYACDANSTSRIEFLGFAIENGVDTNEKYVQLVGIVKGFTALAEGQKYYVQDAVGTIGTTPGTYNVYVGIAISETELLLLKETSHSNGIITKDLADADASTTVIGHGLGSAPKMVRLTGMLFDTAKGQISIGAYSSNGQNYCWGRFSSADNENGTGTGTIRLSTDLTRFQIGTITVDATNITITWAKTSTPSGIFNILWEAEG